MDSKVLSRLEAIEDNLERLRNVEQLLEDIMQSNDRIEKHLAAILEIYRQTLLAQQRPPQ